MECRIAAFLTGLGCQGCANRAPLRFAPPAAPTEEQRNRSRARIRQGLSRTSRTFTYAPVWHGHSRSYATVSRLLGPLRPARRGDAPELPDDALHEEGGTEGLLESAGLSPAEIACLDEVARRAPADVLRVLYEHIEPYAPAAAELQLSGLRLMSFRDFLVEKREASGNCLRTLSLLHSAGVDAAGLDKLLSTCAELSDFTGSGLAASDVEALLETLRGPVGLAGPEPARLLCSRPALLPAAPRLPATVDALRAGGLQGPLLRAAALRLPSILLLEPAQAGAVLAFLAEEVYPEAEGAGAAFAARWPAVLGLSVDRVLRPKLRWLALNGFSTTDLWRAPGYFAASLSGRVAPRCAYLRALRAAAGEAGREAGAVAPLEDLVSLSDGELAARYSFLLRDFARFRRAREKLDGARRVRRFLTELGLSEEEAEEALRRRPSLAAASVGQELSPVRALLEAAGLARADIAAAARRFPAALRCYGAGGACRSRRARRSTSSRGAPPAPRPRPAALRAGSVLGLRGERLARVVARFPQALTLARETLEGKAEFFLDAGLSRAQLGDMVATYPNLLGFSVAGSLAPKAAALAEEAAYGGGLRAAVAFPQFFSLSLEERIAPRLAFLHATGRAGSVPLKRVLDCSDERFASTIARAPLEEYLRFREEHRSQRLRAAALSAAPAGAPPHDPAAPSPHPDAERAGAGKGLQAGGADQEGEAEDELPDCEAPQPRRRRGRPPRARSL
eukprot:tig00000912_g5443.t1